MFSKKKKLDQKQAILNNKGVGICKIVDDSFVKGRSVKYQFDYKGVIYESWVDDYDFKFVVSKYYIVWFDTANPQTSIIKVGSVENGQISYPQ